MPDVTYRGTAFAPQLKQDRTEKLRETKPRWNPSIEVKGKNLERMMKDYSYIIDEMNRQERERAPQIPLQLPVYEEEPRHEREEESSDRGVVIIDFGGND